MTSASGPPTGPRPTVVGPPLQAGGDDGTAFEVALEAAGIGVFDYDVATGGQRFSASCRALWGLADDEAPTPERLVARMHPDDRPLVRQVRASLVAGGSGSFDLQHRIVLPDGRIRWIHARGRTLFEAAPDGGPRRAVRALGTMIDVTQMRVEAELLEAIRRLDSAQAVVEHGLAVLRRVLRVDRCAWSEFEPDGEHSVILGDDAEPGLPSLSGRFATRDFGAGFRSAMLGGTAFVVHDVQAETADPDERAAYAAVGIASAVAWPVHAGGRIAAGVALHHRTPRRWQADEIELVRVVAQRCQEAIHRVRAERRRAEAELRLALALDAAQIFVWERDSAAGMLHWSDNAARVIGCPPEALTADPDQVGFFVHPEDAEAVRAAFARCVAERSERFRLDFRGQPDGDRVRHWLAQGRIIYDERGAATRVIGATQDVTERKAAERAVLEREAMFESFFASAEGILNLFDAELRYVNLDRVTAAFYGLTREAAIGRPLYELNPQAVELLRPIFEEVTTSGRALRGVEITGPVPVRGGEPGVFNLTFFPVTLPGGAPGLGCAGVEVTAMKQAEAALQEADRRKDRFLATLSHELRNPLAPIRNAAHLLAMPQLRDEQLRAARDVIQRQVGHMALLLDDLLDVSRITQGKLALKKAHVALAPLVDAAVETARPLLERKRHVLEVSLPNDPPTLHADPLRVSQVLSNLLHNAAKYTDPGGHIRLSAAVHAGTLVLEVADDGIGIAADALPQLFLMFSQPQGSAGRAEGGLGIGLALVRGLVELHGGRVEALSDGPGRGSTFRVQLPLGEPAQAPAEPSAEAVGEGAARVLVVDDNRDAADTLALLLTTEGRHQVRVAYDGRTALAVAEAFRPDVVLLDLGLPDLPGHEVARRLRHERWGARMRLVALTGWGQDEDRRRSAEAGFDQHLTKPVDPAHLTAVLKAR
jgi:PAS domain S-box-containing protein